MQVRDMKQRSASAHDFAMIPRADIPRSSFRMQKELKTAFGFSYLIPILAEEVLPGDSWNARATIVARTAVPIVPIMDNWHLETFYFFVPCRLLWDNWQKFMGEQTNPGDSISYTIPQLVSAAGGFLVNSIYDYFGLPTVGQVGGAGTISVNAMPMRAYNQIYNQWFRDENLQNSLTKATNDGPDLVSYYGLKKRGKRHDYFTSALPFVQKGTTVTLPLGVAAPVVTSSNNNFVPITSTPMYVRNVTTGTLSPSLQIGAGPASQLTQNSTAFTGSGSGLYPSNLYADLSAATAATINQLRQSFQVQKLLERDARGGTRYTEIVRSHFGVISPDARLQRPEYLGGGKINVVTNAIPQTSATGLTGGTTPAGNLAATGSAQGSNGFTYAATEHGYIIGLASARTDITYSQGLRKMWSRSTRYDFYFPVFAMLGEQAILNKEIYARGDGAAGDDLVFGYQERWAEYRYNPSQITGLMRPTTTGNIAYWHSSQQFGSLPTLNDTFIQDDSVTVLQRNFAAGVLAVDQQLIVDVHYDFNIARPMPMYSVPGLVDHF